MIYSYLTFILAALFNQEFRILKYVTLILLHTSMTLHCIAFDNVLLMYLYITMFFLQLGSVRPYIRPYEIVRSFR